MPRKKPTVMGVHAPPPRPTLSAAFLVALYFGLPIICLLFAIDLLIWLAL